VHRINAQNGLACGLGRERLKRPADLRHIGVTLEFAQKAGCDELPADEVALQPCEIDAVVGKSADGPKQRAGRIGHLEQQAGHDVVLLRRRNDRFRRKHVKARQVEANILDIALQDRQSVGLGGKAGGHRCGTPVAFFLDAGCGRRRIALRDRDKPVGVEKALHLLESNGMRVHPADFVQGPPVRGHQVEFDGQEHLAHDRQSDVRQKHVDVGHPSGEDVLAWQYGHLGPSAPHRIDDLEQVFAGNAARIRESGSAGDMREGAGAAMIDDGFGGEAAGGKGARRQGKALAVQAR
jgi:hypothetical protein